MQVRSYSDSSAAADDAMTDGRPYHVVIRTDADPGLIWTVFPSRDFKRYRKLLPDDDVEEVD